MNRCHFQNNLQQGTGQVGTKTKVEIETVQELKLRKIDWKAIKEVHSLLLDRSKKLLQVHQPEWSN